jgi:hypothetical protein
MELLLYSLPFLRVERESIQATVNTRPKPSPIRYQLQIHFLEVAEIRNDPLPWFAIYSLAPNEKGGGLLTSVISFLV